MAVDERERNALHNRLTEVLGEDAALTLMRHLPPTGWGDVATKHDLEVLEAKLEVRLDGLETRLESRMDAKISGVEVRLLREMAKQTRIFVFAMLTGIVTTAGIAFGAAGLG